jgi:shikimate kinase
VVLIGLSGAGKTTVAALLAERLGATWRDADEEIAAAAGMSVSAIFATRGEAAFRDLERAAMERLLHREPGIIAAGGGWAAIPGNLAGVGARALVVYLRVAPEVAAARLAAVSDRPLLNGGDGNLRDRLAELLAAREPWYRQAEIAVSAEGTPDEVADRVWQAAGRVGGW